MSVIADPVIQKAVANIKQRSEKQRDIQKSLDSFVDLGVIPQIATENKPNCLWTTRYWKDTPFQLPRSRAVKGGNVESCLY